MTRLMDSELGGRFADTALAESTDLLGMDSETRAWLGSTGEIVGLIGPY